MEGEGGGGWGGGGVGVGVGKPHGIHMPVFLGVRFYLFSPINSWKSALTLSY